MLRWGTHGHPECSWLAPLSAFQLVAETQLEILDGLFCSLFRFENITVTIVILLSWNNVVQESL